MQAASLTSCNAADVLGRTEPRLWTPPRRELTPATSYGFDVVEFADEVIRAPLDPWQEWAAIHGGELLEDGRPRFRKLLLIVARQNGKTHLLVVLALYWLFVERVRLVLGTSTNLGYAKESLEKAVELAESDPTLAPLVDRVRRAAGEEALIAEHGGRYRIAAANRRGGRSLTIDRLILDELREHHTWDAWNASYNATNAVPDAQAWAITNQGDTRSVVLESLRSDAVETVDGVDRIRTDGDPELGVFEWSAPPGSSADDVDALAQANPNLGRRINARSLVADGARAIRNGGEELASFQTEVMCMRVDNLDPAVDAAAWRAGEDTAAFDIPADGPGVMCLDVSLDEKHATLCAGVQLPDGRVRVGVVQAWDELGRMRRELPRLVGEWSPRVFAWFPNGPAAAVAAALRARKGTKRAAVWPPRGVRVEEIGGEAAPVCMGFAEAVVSGDVVHNGDELLTGHVTGAERSRQGDAWRFTRRGAGHCDAAYAAAGVVHLARTMPKRRRARLVVAPDPE